MTRKKTKEEQTTISLMRVVRDDYRKIKVISILSKKPMNQIIKIMIEDYLTKYHKKDHTEMQSLLQKLL